MECVNSSVYYKMLFTSHMQLRIVFVTKHVVKLKSCYDLILVLVYQQTSSEIVSVYITVNKKKRVVVNFSLYTSNPNSKIIKVTLANQIQRTETIYIKHDYLNIKCIFY